MTELLTELLTAAQMRAIELAAMESGEVTGLELMERAGRGVVEAIFEEWPVLAGPVAGAAPSPSVARTDGATDDRPPGYLEKAESRRAVVLCGPGNNGGDGFVVARLLLQLGWAVEVFLYGDAENLPVDARTNYERWREQADVGNLSDLADQGVPDRTDLVIDALFGTGLARGLSGEPFLRLAAIFNRSPKRTWKSVAIDLPSGLCSDSGRVLTVGSGGEGLAFHADLTVTFHSAKPAHVLENGPSICGRVRVWSIGLRADPTEVRQVAGIVDADAGDLRSLAKSDGHKYSHGHALILSGGVGKGGAARLAARGALRVGAGLVTVGCPPAALQENACRLDAIMLRAIKGGDALAEMLEDTRINTLCVGPGIGVTPEKAALLSVVLEARRATVLDADALTMLASDAALFGKLHDGCVLTPHSGEFARLFPDIFERLSAPAVRGPASSKIDATRKAAVRAGCVVLFKGPDTVIATPDGRCSVSPARYERSAPWLATAGSGDVLAGLITGLLARGFDPMAAAETGAWLHVECALKFGPGLIAEDLPEQLPAVFRDILG